MTPSDTTTTRELAQAFALASLDLVQALEAGDLEGAGRCAANRGRILPALRTGEPLDAVSAALLADGCANGARAMELVRTRAEALRDELEDVERGRSGINAYSPAGPDSAACDITR